MWAPTEPVPHNFVASAARGWRNRHGRYRLAGTRCEPCDLAFFPPRLVCPQCQSRKLSDCEFARSGTVVCHAEDHTPLVGHGGRSVRPFAIVALDGGPSVLTEIVDTDHAAVVPGMAVEAVLRKWRRETNGLYQYGYKFRPARSMS